MSRQGVAVPSQSSARSPHRPLLRTATKIYLMPLIPIAVLMALMLALGVVFLGVEALAALFRHYQI
jgi:hypothetical protein